MTSPPPPPPPPTLKLTTPSLKPLTLVDTGRTVVALLGVVRQYLTVERNFSGYQYQVLEG